MPLSRDMDRESRAMPGTGHMHWCVLNPAAIAIDSNTGDVAAGHLRTRRISSHLLPTDFPLIMETLMVDTARFWDRIAEKYAKSPVKDEESYRHTLDRVKAHLDPDARVLEIGCGTGSTALHLAGNVREIVATDISPGMIDIARRKASEARTENATFAAEDTLSNGRPDAPFDVVMGFNVFHLLREPGWGLASAMKLVRPGGLFISKTPCLKGANLLYPIMIPLMRLIGKAPYVAFFTVEQLEAMITDAGGEILETGTFPKSPPSRFIVARKPD